MRFSKHPPENYTIEYQGTRLGPGSSKMSDTVWNLLSLLVRADAPDNKRVPWDRTVGGEATASIYTHDYQYSLDPEFQEFEQAWHALANLTPLALVQEFKTNWMHGGVTKDTLDRMEARAREIDHLFVQEPTKSEESGNSQVQVGNVVHVQFGRK